MDSEKIPLRALVIEDSDDDVLLLLKELRRGSFHPSYLRVDAKDTLATALEQEWDVVFCDYSMPKMNGMQALKIVRHHDQDVPFIFVSGTIGEELAVEAMRTGAQDYIMKGNLRRLVPAVLRELKESSDRKMRRQAEMRLHFLAHYDELTGLANRSYFHQLLNDTIEEAKTTGQLLLVAYIDLDRFKTINDSLGYEAGNILLQHTANRLKTCVAQDAIIARIAADEFTILVKYTAPQDSVYAIIDDIKKALAEPYDIYGCMLYIGASIGLSLFPEDASSATSLVRNADIASNRVKNEGGKHHRFYSSDMAVKLDERLALDSAMRQALPNQEFIVHYQPQVEVATTTIAGVEALVRWNRGNNVLTSPFHFIPLAEETGFILPLGAWILQQSCIQASQWHAKGFNSLRIAVNLSARQFYQEDLIPMVKDVLDEYRLDPACLELEITESAIIQDTKRALYSLEKLQSMGVKVALDDFGTGYSSLSHLKHFKVDTLKIDRTFIMGIPHDRDAMAITSAVIAMADKLDIKVVAEGVETREQYDFLKSEGCCLVQGYFLGKPVGAETITSLLENKLIVPS